jgi:hypothetical protein
MANSDQDYVRRAQRFVQEYTQGLNVQDFRRLFDRDATHAYKVLARDQDPEQLPQDGFKRFFHRLRIVFLGLSYKLSPARRLLFVVSLLFVLVGLVSGPGIEFGNETIATLSATTSPTRTAPPTRSAATTTTSSGSPTAGWRFSWVTPAATASPPGC